MDNFRALFYALQKEFRGQENMLELLSKERSAIVKLDTEAVEKINRFKLNLFDSAKKNQASRETIVQRIHAELPKDSEKPQKLDSLLEYCSCESTKSEIKYLGRDLKDLTIEVKKYHEENSALIRQSLGMINSTLTIITSNSEAQPQSYGKQGTLKKPEKQTALRNRTTA